MMAPDRLGESTSKKSFGILLCWMSRVIQNTTPNYIFTATVVVKTTLIFLDKKFINIFRNVACFIFPFHSQKHICFFCILAFYLIKINQYLKKISHHLSTCHHKRQGPCVRRDGRNDHMFVCGSYHPGEWRVSIRNLPGGVATLHSVPLLSYSDIWWVVECVISRQTQVWVVLLWWWFTLLLRISLDEYLQYFTLLIYT